MKRQVMWSRLDAPGMEHLRLTTDADGVVAADGLVLSTENGSAFRLRYSVRCDSRWRVRRVEISFLDDARTLALTAEARGIGMTGRGRLSPRSTGAWTWISRRRLITNTLPIRRLALKPGQHADIKVAYIIVPELIWCEFANQPHHFDIALGFSLQQAR